MDWGRLREGKWRVDRARVEGGRLGIRGLIGSG